MLEMKKALFLYERALVMQECHEDTMKLSCLGDLGAWQSGCGYTKKEKKVIGTGWN